MNETAAAWFDRSTDGAPEVLCDRARWFFDHAPGTNVASRLALAGHRALAAAVLSGADRAAALDLLAADALITLALLAHAERDPATLATYAAALRGQVSATS